MPESGKGKRESLKVDLRNGRRTVYHLINRCSLAGYEAPDLVANFGNASSVPLDYAKSLTKSVDKRIRLLPPHREHLAQGFERYYICVGLPIAIDPFDD